MLTFEFVSTLTLIFICHHTGAFMQISSKFVHRPSLNANARVPSWYMTKTSVNEIERVHLGSSDLLVSKVCLGTMTWGQQNTEEEGIQQLNYAFDKCGINFLDTAEMYPVPTKAETQGKTDMIISKWLKTVDRSKVILATKVAGFSETITWLPGRGGGGSRVSRDQIMSSIDASLERLGTDYVDLLQIHWPDRLVSSYNIPCN
jgi:aryl-alcohol dehydrogenase-like predicted oxidoreductase